MTTDGMPRKSDDELFELAQDEYQRASRRIDEGRLNGSALTATVRRLQEVADLIRDPALRAVVIGDCEELEAAPAARAANLSDGAADDASGPSQQLRDAQSIVAWAWEDLPEPGARQARVQDALRRLERMPQPEDTTERRELAELQAQLMRLASALGQP
jgi:hypothetical protein